MKTIHDSKTNQVYPRHENVVVFDDTVHKKNCLGILEYIQRESNLFQGSSSEFIQQLVPLSEVNSYEKGAIILQEGESNNRIYFLLKGHVGIYKGTDAIIKLRRKGDIFGEMSLVSNKLCSATVKAECETMVFRIQVKEIGEKVSDARLTLTEVFYKLYVVILTDKLAMTTLKASGLEKRVKERTLELRIKSDNLKIAKEKAEEADRTKNEFLSNISHELRTPMHHILSFAGICVEKTMGIIDSSVKDYLERILSSGKKLNQLINNLLELSKFSSGGTKLSTKEEDLFSIIEGVKRELQFMVDEKNLLLWLEKPLFKTTISCDKTKIEQVIRNLIINAIKFTPSDKKICISIEDSTIRFFA